jgi:predicted O-methyltransferase YrrM
MNDIQGTSLVALAEKIFIAKHLPVECKFLEVGTWSGATASLLCDMRPDIKMVCVDPYTGGQGNNMPRASNVWQWIENARERPMTLVVGDLSSLIVLQGPDAAPFDVAFIDGEHSFNSCLSDLETAASILTPDGVLFTHDYWEGPPKDAVDAFCKDSEWAITGREGRTVQLKREATE